MKKIITICLLLSFVTLVSGCAKTTTDNTTWSWDCNTDTSTTTCALPIN